MDPPKSQNQGPSEGSHAPTMAQAREGQQQEGREGEQNQLDMIQRVLEMMAEVVASTNQIQKFQTEIQTIARARPHIPLGEPRGTVLERFMKLDPPMFAGTINVTPQNSGVR